MEYEFGELDEVSIADAANIHNSQGSEYPAFLGAIADLRFSSIKK